MYTKTLSKSLKNRFDNYYYTFYFNIVYLRELCKDRNTMKLVLLTQYELQTSAINNRMNEQKSAFISELQLQKEKIKEAISKKKEKVQSLSRYQKEKIQSLSNSLKALSQRTSDNVMIHLDVINNLNANDSESHWSKFVSREFVNPEGLDFLEVPGSLMKRSVKKVSLTVRSLPTPLRNRINDVENSINEMRTLSMHSLQHSYNSVSCSINEKILNEKTKGIEKLSGLSIRLKNLKNKGLKKTAYIEQKCGSNLFNLLKRFEMEKQAEKINLQNLLQNKTIVQTINLFKPSCMQLINNSKSISKSIDKRYFNSKIEQFCLQTVKEYLEHREDVLYITRVEEEYRTEQAERRERVDQEETTPGDSDDLKSQASEVSAEEGDCITSVGKPMYYTTLNQATANLQAYAGSGSSGTSSGS